MGKANTTKAAKANASTAAEKLALVRGGVDIEISYRARDEFDDAEFERLKQFESALGTKERVKVREIRVTRMAEYLNAIEHGDAALIELFCDRAVGWSETLTNESQLAVLQKGQEINLPFFESWYQINVEKAKALRPALIREIESRILAQVKNSTSSPSTTTAPGSPSDVTSH